MTNIIPSLQNYINLTITNGIKPSLEISMGENINVFFVEKQIELVKKIRTDGLINNRKLPINWWEYLKNFPERLDSLQ